MIDPNNEKRWLAAEEIRQFRTKLFEEQGGLCHWCKKPMRLVLGIPPQKNMGDVATFEHLSDRLSPGGRKRDRESIVASCSDCNNARNKERTALVIAAAKTHFGEGFHAFSNKKSITEVVAELNRLGINPLKD
jgi:hypothetical protein